MLGSSSDPFIKALKSFGYLTVRLPKADIAPLQILSKNGKNLERLGPVVKLLTPGDNIGAPTISLGALAANINGQRTGEMKIGLGLSLLGSIIGAMSGSTMGVDVEYKQAKSAVFEFTDVTEDKIDIIDLDQYLGDADINPASVFVSKLLEADELYITTAVIKSAKFIFDAKQSGGVGVKVNVPVIQGAVGGNVTVGASGAADSKVTYEGKIPLVFGFQAVRLFFDGGKFTSLVPAEGVALKGLGNIESSLSEEKKVEQLMVDDCFVRLRD